jgi:hypothetical protein
VEHNEYTVRASTRGSFSAGQVSGGWIAAAGVGSAVLVPFLLAGLVCSDGSERTSPAPEARAVARAPISTGRVPDPGSRIEPQAVKETGFGELVVPEMPAESAEPEDHSYSNIDPREREKGRYDRRELAVLQAIIDQNQLTEDSSAADYDDGDGVFEPLEFGTQVWCGSHLRALYSGPSEFGSFGYGLRSLPASIADLRYLSRLSLNFNQIEELPVTIGSLKELRVLELYDNRIRALPQSMSTLLGLEVLQLRGNQLREVPDAVVELPKLNGLFLADNPIVRPSRSLALRAQAQVAPDPRVVRRRVDCSPES